MREHTFTPSPTQGSPMWFRTVRVCTLAIVALLGIASCNEGSTEPGSVDDLNRLHVTYDYPKLADTVASFWAVKGRSSGVDLWYHARAGTSDSAKFVEFRLDPAALDRRPDGSAIAVGDSVLITLRATDATHMQIELLPTGLHFAPGSNATLRIFWTACGDDVNYDGVVNAADDSLIGMFTIWRQEHVSDPWTPLPSGVIKSNHEVNTRLSGFSGYIISY